MSGEFTPKFLATVDEQGLPNLVLIASIEPATDTRMVFADFLMNKTGKNLDRDAKVGVLVITEQLDWWSMTADHVGWERTGDLVDHFNSNDLFRYNAYTGIRRAGKMDLRSMPAKGKYGKLALLTDFASTKMTAGKFAQEVGPDKMPFRVMQKFSRLAAIKVFSYIGADGYPVILPILSAQPADAKTLVFGMQSSPNALRDIPKNTPCAINVVTFEPVSYQVKGTFAGFSGTTLGKKGVIAIDSVWSTSPPLCGERIDLDTRIL
jgi:hypothetical protein